MTTDPKRLTLPLTFGVAVIVVLLWSTPFIYPFKLIVVGLHEFSHVLMTWATGGEVVQFSLNPYEGGHVMSRGGNTFLILQAGYLGSLLFGWVLLWLADRTDLDRLFVFLLGVAFLLSPLLGPTVSGSVLGLLLGVGCIAIAAKAGLTLNDLILRVIGLVSVAYVPLDIISDTILRSAWPSDARRLAETYGGWTLLWGGVWLALSLAFNVWAYSHFRTRDEKAEEPA